MSPLSRLFERVRDDLGELGESIAGSQAQRILDRDIRETDAQLHGWRGELATFKAHRLAGQQRVDAAATAIVERENHALRALELGNEPLAREVAQLIATLEQEAEAEQARVAELDARIAAMSQVIAQGENALRRLKHQLDSVRATQSVQRAQAEVARRLRGDEGALPTALDAARRLLRPEPAPPERPPPATPASAHADLDARLRAAGILDQDLRTGEVLQRLSRRLDPHDQHAATPRGRKAPRKTAPTPRTRPPRRPE